MIPKIAVMKNCPLHRLPKKPNDIIFNSFMNKTLVIIAVVFFLMALGQCLIIPPIVQHRLFFPEQKSIPVKKRKEKKSSVKRKISLYFEIKTP